MEIEKQRWHKETKTNKGNKRLKKQTPFLKYFFFFLLYIFFSTKSIYQLSKSPSWANEFNSVFFRDFISVTNVFHVLDVPIDVPTFVSMLKPTFFGSLSRRLWLAFMAVDNFSMPFYLYITQNLLGPVYFITHKSSNFLTRTPTSLLISLGNKTRMLKAHSVDGHSLNYLISWVTPCSWLLSILRLPNHSAVSEPCCFFGTRLL